MYSSGIRVYLLDNYNLLDFIVLSLYLASYMLRFLVDRWIKQADRHYNGTERAREALVTRNYTEYDHMKQEIFYDDHMKREIFYDDHMKQEIFYDDHMKQEIFYDDHTKQEIFYDDHMKQEIFYDDHTKQEIFYDDHMKHEIFYDDHTTTT